MSTTTLPVEIPEDYRDFGFTGTFTIESRFVGTAEEAAEFAAKLPARLPFGSNSAWLGLCMVPNAPEPTVLLVRRDSAALADFMFGPR